MKIEEIVIIGGGLAGLTTAYGLEKTGIPYLLLEARERIGGRVHTIATPTGATIEMGATWFAEKHVHLMRLIRELEVPYQHQYTGTRVLYDYANPGRTAQLFEVPTSNEAQYLFTDGSQSLINALYQKLDPKRIQSGQKVQKLNFGERFVTIFTDKGEIRARRVINTLPPNLFVNAIQITPALPSKLMEIARSTHTWMGESIKAGLEYTEAFWRKHEIGSLLSQFGPAQELHDHHHVGKEGNVLKGFIHSNLHSEGRKEREDKVMEQMRFYFGSDLADATYFEKDWQSDPLTYHPYESDVMPHQYNGHPLYRESYFDDRLYFAGSETAQAFPGYLDGAVERGIVMTQMIQKWDIEATIKTLS